MSNAAMPVPCDHCGAPIEGASVWEHSRPFHPWCWHVRARAVNHPGLDYAARDLCAIERPTQEA